MWSSLLWLRSYPEQRYQCRSGGLNIKYQLLAPDWNSQQRFLFWHKKLTHLRCQMKASRLWKLLHMVSKKSVSLAVRKTASSLDWRQCISAFVPTVFRWNKRGHRECPVTALFLPQWRHQSCERARHRTCEDRTYNGSQCAGVKRVLLNVFKISSIPPLFALSIGLDS